ncbi:MAG: TetR/AcrR family transcriptional regulator [Treponema sp.]|jgi:AcrR family transcriptional regulator|nr:TetR/AcrR family transcriptional regulator [Treponema sp.]
MNQTDIIETALRVWGRELYKTTSLSHVAQALGVTKPALYRHFASKKALLDGMFGYYCDHYMNCMKESYNKALESRDPTQGILRVVRNIAGYYVRHKYIFVFFLFEVFGNRSREEDIPNQFALRGMDVGKRWFSLNTPGDYPDPFRLILPGVFFLITLFHTSRAGDSADPAEGEIRRFLSAAEEIISHGLGLDRRLVDALDFGALEKTGNYRLPPEGENGGLLKAVAGAVAQAGPWNASMDMVAKRSGLSKSGLYAHFKSKADMLGRMFMTEFDRIVQHAELGKGLSEKPEEQFYLTILAIANYLRSRPEILITLDWMRTRRLDLGLSAPPGVYRLFTGIELKAAGLAGLDPTGETLAHWTLFLIVNTLMRRPEGMSFSDVPDASFRILYKFIALGIKGWD